jgi:cob(I)alamin adenosyltransferase
MSVNEADRNARHAARMQRKKAVVDEKMAQATQDKGLILILTGNGKGKSSSGFGMAARALGHGMRVGIVQFIKGATRPQPMEGRTSKASRASLSARAPRLDPIGEGSYSTGEEAFFRRFAEVEYHVMGEGFTWETQDRERDIQAARAAWEKALGLLRNPAIHLVLLDELNIALKYGYLSLTEVVEALQNKPPMQHVIVTGRSVKPELVAIADTVSEVMDVKHAFRAGIRAQKGVEL